MNLPLTREEAQRQIAELQRHIDSLPKNNHPASIECGMLFRHESGDLYLVVRSGSDGLDLRNTSSGNTWFNGKCFDGDENEFEYLGHAKDLLTIKTDKPAEVVVTSEMAQKALSIYKHDVRPDTDIMPTHTIETKYYHFSQNNSGGSFIHKPNEGIVHHVIIEAMNADHANHRAEKIGLYFDGCDDATDCSCCGDRWCRTSERDANDTPMVYGKPAESYADKLFTDKGEPSVAIHHLNKPFTLCGVTP